MRLIFAYADYHESVNTSQWRCFIPAAGLKRAGHDVQLVTVAELVAAGGQGLPPEKHWDALVIERELFLCLETIPKWQGAGIPVIASFDDAYHLMPPNVSTAKVWRMGKAGDGKKYKLMQQFKKALRMCDAFITPSNVLTADYLLINRNGHTVKNYPDLTWDCWKVPRREPDGKVRMVWGGSWTHYDSWNYSGIVPAMRRILADHPEASLTLVGGDLRIMSLFSGLGPGRVIHKDRVPFEEWPALLGEYDIGLAPLHGQYDRRRSWIKVLEYCLMGLWPIASPMEPYEGLPCSFPKKNRAIDWHNAIEYAIHHLAHYRESGVQEQALRWANAQGIDDHVDEYISVLEEAIERRRGESQKS